MKDDIDLRMVAIIDGAASRATGQHADFAARLRKMIARGWKSGIVF